MGTSAELAMFPLGTVLLPYTALPLHVFEPRYRALVEHCLADAREFGVVLIERGSEVGGDDTRFGLGTVARIVEAARFDDGRYAILTVGAERFRVRRWLDEDPFPRAMVERLAAPAAPDRGTELMTRVRRVLVAVAARRTELGEPGPPVDVALSDDPVRAAYEAGAMAGLGPLDALELLGIDDGTELARRLEEMLLDQLALLDVRIGGGDGDPVEPG